MTDKIIIDGVDVSGCEFYDNSLGIFSNKDKGKRYCYDCSLNPGCHYKQLAREQKRANQSHKDCIHNLVLLKRKKEECERMKKALNKIRDYELNSLDVEWDEYEVERSSTEYSPIIDYVEIGLGEVEDE